MIVMVVILWKKKEVERGRNIEQDDGRIRENAQEKVYLALF